MEAFNAETAEIFQRFRAGDISRTECIIRLDVAFAALIPRLGKYQAEAIRPSVTAKNQSVIKRIAKSRRKVFWLNDSRRPRYRNGIRSVMLHPVMSLVAK
jgi:hypothetical protein